LQRNGVLPEDVVVNTWHAVTPGGTLADVEEVVADLEAFYGTIQGYLSDLLHGAATVKVYDLLDPTPRVAVVEDDFTIVPGSGTPLPAECASVLSFRGEPLSGEPNARRRGRVYLGPLNASSIEGGSGPDMLLDADHMTTITAAADTFGTALQADGNQWAIYSPTTDLTEGLPLAFVPVTDGWMDNAVDIVRKRGGRATTRVTFAL
jgi:hypothetical protein